MELLWLKYFCDAAETENFSETARKFFVPPSNISQTIKKLEAELGMSLFDRTKNKLTLSRGGKIYYEGIKKALMELDGAKNALCDSAGEISGEISLKVETNRRIVTDAIEKFGEIYDSVSFKIRHGGGNDGDFDIIITDAELDEKKFKKIPLIKERLCLAVSEKNPLAAKEKIMLSDLSSEHFITMNEGSSMHSHVLSICQGAGFEPNISICTDDPFYIRKYVEMGLGIAIFPSFSWKGQFSGSVVLRDLGNYTRTTYLYRPVGKYETRASALFEKILAESAELDSI